MPIVQLACWAWIAVVAAYFAWEYATYSGLYRWLAERQIALFGKYALHLTAILPVIVVAGPAFSIIARAARRGRSADGAEAGGPAEHETARRNARILFAIVPICFAVSLGAFLIGKGEEVPPGDPVRIDLATFGDATPPSGRVTLVGTVLVDRGLTTTVTGRFGQVQENFYAPVVAPGRQAGEAPYRFFVKRTTSRSSDGRPLRQMFLGAETGVLVRDGLPSDVQAMLAKAGAAPAEPSWMLTTATARTDLYYATAAVAGLVGLILLLGGGGGLLAARIRARRSRGG